MPVHVLLGYDANGGASVAELEAHFSPATAEPTASTDVPNEASREAEPLPSMQAEEGALSLEEHLVRERNTDLAAAKRADVLRTTGRLVCETCSFDFAVSYGEIGNGFCEVHHTKPLGLRSGSETTSLQDLAILCSNCHSIIHRTDPMWNVAELAGYMAMRAPSR